MTNEQIIEMAKVYRTWKTDSGGHIFNDQTVVHFARAVAQEAARQENEACAKLCEPLKVDDGLYSEVRIHCAKLIRSRSSATGEKG